MQQGFSHGGRLPWPAIGLAALVWLMSVAYGFQYLVMDNTAAHLSYFRVATVPYAIIVVLLTWHALRDPALSRDIEQIPPAVGWVLMSVSWVLTCYFYSSKLSFLPWPIVAAALPAAAALAQRKWGSRGSVWCFVAGALALIAFLASRLAHDVAGGDMLQIIDFAIRDLLDGHSPFRRYLTVSGKEVMFGYWPGVWLPYLPVIALGLDMRVLNVFLMGLVVLLFWKASGGGERGARILSIVLFPVLLSTPLMQMALSGHLWLYWLLSAATLLFVVRGQYTLAAVMFGLCLASRPTALFLAGPILAYVWTQAGLRAALAGGGVSAGVLLALNLPFYLIYGDVYLQANFGYLSGIGHQLTHFSIEGILQAVGLGALGKPLQVATSLAAMAFIFVKRPLAPEKFIMLVGVAYIWEILFASYATRYMYFSGFLLVALGLVLAQTRSAAGAERVSRNGRVGATVSARA